VAALPYIDQEPLYNEISQYFEVAVGNPPNVGMGYTGTTNNSPSPRDLAKRVIPSLICPSNDQTPMRTNQIIEPDAGGWNAPYFAEAGGLDYVGNMGHIWGGWKDCNNVPDFPHPQNRMNKGSNPGTPWISERWNNDNPAINGVFFYRGSVNIPQITDGTANTVMLFECMHWRGGDNVGIGFQYSHTDTANWAGALGAVYPMRHPINNQNQAWQYGPGDVRNPGPSSRHPGGMHAVLADGSVRFIGEGIDHVLKYNLAVRNDGEVVGEF
jgi:prepilin-type processing-associated H-X9-DG protein